MEPHEVAAADQHTMANRIVACQTMAQTAFRFRTELVNAGFALGDAQVMTEIWLQAVCEGGHDVPHDM